LRLRWRRGAGVSETEWEYKLRFWAWLFDFHPEKGGFVRAGLFGIIGSQWYTLILMAFIALTLPLVMWIKVRHTARHTRPSARTRTRHDTHTRLMCDQDSPETADKSQLFAVLGGFAGASALALLCLTPMDLPDIGTHPPPPALALISRMRAWHGLTFFGIREHAQRTLWRACSCRWWPWRPSCTGPTGATCAWASSPSSPSPGSSASVNPTPRVVLTTSPLRHTTRAHLSLSLFFFRRVELFYLQFFIFFVVGIYTGEVRTGLS
jgi:hypothetical protein